jgi:hypothetical protein
MAVLVNVSYSYSIQNCKNQNWLNNIEQAIPHVETEKLTNAAQDDDNLKKQNKNTKKRV